MDDYKRTALEKNLEKAKSNTEKMMLLVMAMDEEDLDDGLKYLRAVVLKDEAKVGKAT